MKYIIFLHRWLGVAGCVLFLGWFVSGIVMMYAGMPGLSEEQRLAALPRLDAGAINISAASAIERAHLLGLASIKLTSLFGRPVWRMQGVEGAWCTVFTDTGEVARSFDYGTAKRSLRPFATANVHPRLLRAADASDQWTVSGDYDDVRPLYHVALDDAAGTEFYISGATGEVVLRTTARTRALAWVGAIPHWIYFTGVRKHAANWRLLVIWLAGAGCVAAVLGLIAGLWRWAKGSTRDWSPYRGTMRWHHGAGLLFGILTLTWTFSGMLSLEPGGYSTGSSPTAAQQEAFSGTLDYTLYSESPARALAANPAKELELHDVAGRPYYLLKDSPGHTTLVAVNGEAVPEFPEAFLIGAAQRAVPDSRIVERTLLTRYDAYYYDRDWREPLPVLRLKFDDPVRSWLYLDPSRALIVARYERSGRIDRWLYQGLHHWDFPWLWFSRPAWDIIVIALLAGGIFLSGSGVLLGYRRLRISLRRVAAKILRVESKNFRSKFRQAG